MVITGVVIRSAAVKARNRLALAFMVAAFMANPPRGKSSVPKRRGYLTVGQILCQQLSCVDGWATGKLPILQIDSSHV
jgi:hypothetical protein